MPLFNSPFNSKSLVVIVLFTMFSVQAFTQKNSDGSYTLRLQDRAPLIFYPAHPGKTDREIDTLSFKNENGVEEMFFRVSERMAKVHNDNFPKRMDVIIKSKEPRKSVNPDGSLSTSYDVEPPPCNNCQVDTIERELPDGSFDRIYIVRDAKNILKKDLILIPGQEAISVEVYENAEEMPKFLSSDLKNYIEKNIKFTTNGKRYVGHISLRFIVLKNGKIENITFNKTYNAPPEGLEKDISRILKSMPAWKPGMVYGKAVNAYYNCGMMLVID